MGLTRSAILMILFIVIHAVGNLHVFLGPDDFNGYGYFYVRLYWTGFGLPANIVEEYILLGVLLHVFVALKRTWDINLSQSVSSGKLNLAITGIALLTFMTVHLFQFRFGETQQFKLCSPPYLVNIMTLFHLKLNLFWVDYPGCQTSEVRDIYRLEFEVFRPALNHIAGSTTNCTNHPRNELKTYMVGGDNIASNARRFFKKYNQPVK